MAVTELLESKFGGDIPLFLLYSSLFIRKESKSQTNNLNNARGSNKGLNSRRWGSSEAISWVVSHKGF